MLIVRYYRDLRAGGRAEGLNMLPRKCEVTINSYEIFLGEKNILYVLENGLLDGDPKNSIKERNINILPLLYLYVLLCVITEQMNFACSIESV